MYRHQINKKKAYSKRNTDIKKMYKCGVSVESLAKSFKCTQQNIYNILNES